jgi:transposase
VTFGELEALVVELRGLVGELRASVAKSEAAVERLNETLASRDARIVELERLLEESRRSGKRQAAPFRKNSRVTDPKPPGRKPGQAHGRHGHRLPPVSPDRTLDAPCPTSCPDCGGTVDHLRDADQFQTDLPPLPPPATTQFKVGVGRCRACGKRVQGRHTEQTSDALGAAGAMVGPNIKGWAAWMHYSLGIPFAKISRFFHARFGLSVTAGALCQAAQTTASTALVPVNTQIRERINQSPMVVMDETGWRVNAESAWVWIATTPDLTYYTVAGSRSFDDANLLVDATYAGTLVHDGWCVYDQYTAATHQTCLAHLCRRADELIESLPAGHRHTPRYVRQLLGEGLAARDGDEIERGRVIVDLTERIELLAEQAHPHDENRKLVNHLHRNRTGLFTFLADPTIDATSWRAEQGIRPTTVTRKVCGCNRSQRGALTQGRMMTLFRTASQQSIDAVEYLIELARAPDPTTIRFLR